MHEFVLGNGLTAYTADAERGGGNAGAHAARSRGLYRHARAAEFAVHGACMHMRIGMNRGIRLETTVDVHVYGPHAGLAKTYAHDRERRCYTAVWVYGLGKRQTSMPAASKTFCDESSSYTRFCAYMKQGPYGDSTSP